MRRSLPVFEQIVQLIPPGTIEKLCAACRIKARVFSYAFQIYALMLGQLVGAFSLNEICDTMQVHAKKLLRVRGLLPARRNTFSNANRTRDPDVVEKLFWEMYGRLRSLAPKFVHPKHRGRLARFRLRRIVALDSTVLQLTHKAIDWAKHRRRKAAAKLHMLCDVASRLPVAYCSSWEGSYMRFSGVVRAALWERTDLTGLLKTCGTAPPPPESDWEENTPCLPGFERYCARAMG